MRQPWINNKNKGGTSPRSTTAAIERGVFAGLAPTPLPYHYCSHVSQPKIGQVDMLRFYWTPVVESKLRLHPKGQKIFLEDRPPPLLSQGLDDCAPPLPLSEGLDLPLCNNIATTHLCLQSLCLPCSPCRGKNLGYFEPQNLGLALCFFSGWNKI